MKSCVFIAVLLFLGLFFSCETVNNRTRIVEKTENSAGNPAVTEGEEENFVRDSEKTVHKENITNEEPEELRIPEENSGKELEREEFFPLVTRFRPSGYYPIHKNGEPLTVYGDLDGNGYGDVIVLYAERESYEEAELGILSDSSRLYDSEAEAFPVLVLSFLQYPGEKVFPGALVPLDEKLVFTSLSPLYIHKDRSLPLGISANFQMYEGFLREWIIYNRPEKPVSLLLRETPSIHTVTEDIDGDGTVDVLVYERDFEEGTGYETFITWYYWNGGVFEEKAATNIVRNINRYLERVKESILSGNWRQFLDTALPKSVYPELPREYDPDYQLFMKVFTLPEDVSPGEREGEEEWEWGWQDIRNVIFPEILENPFDLKDRKEYLFPLEIRIVYNNAVILYRVQIEMAGNPFDNPQFWFVLNG